MTKIYTTQNLERVETDEAGPGEIIGEFGSKIMLGEVSVEQGSKEIGTRMEAILKKEGYYDGKKELLQ